MFDVSNLEVESIFKSIASIEDYAHYCIHYKYGGKKGLAYAKANDELGAYQELLKQLEERYKNG